MRKVRQDTEKRKEGLKKDGKKVEKCKKKRTHED